MPPSRKWLRTVRYCARGLCLVGCGLVVFALVMTGLALRVASRGLPPEALAAIERELSSPGLEVSLDGTSVHVQQDFSLVLRSDAITFRAARSAESLEKGEPPEAFLTLRNARLNMRRPGISAPSARWLRLVRSLDCDEVELPFVPHFPGLDEPPDPAGSVLSRIPMPPVPVHVASAQVLGLGTARNVSALVSITNATLRVDNIDATFSPPSAPLERTTGTFAFRFRPFSAEGHVAGTLRPDRVTAVMRAPGIDLEDTPRYVDDFRAPDVPARLRLDYVYDPASGTRTLSLPMEFGACSYQGVDFLSASGSLLLEGGPDPDTKEEHWRTLSITNIVAERPEGTLRQNLLIDFALGTLAVEADSTIDPHHLPALSGVHEFRIPASVRFSADSRLSWSGIHAFAGSRERSRLAAEFSAESLTIQKFKAERIRASATLDDAVLSCTATNVCYGGTGFLSGSIVFSTNAPAEFKSQVVLRDVDNARLCAGLNADMPEDRQLGTLDLDLTLGGDFGSNLVQRLKGGGECKIRDAEFYRLPLFAGLTTFLGRNVPGVDFLLAQSNLQSRFKIGDDQLSFKELRIRGAIFSIDASHDATYWLSKGLLDCGVQVQILRETPVVGRMLSYVLFPVSKLFEFEVTGPLSNPTWSPTTLALRGRRSYEGDSAAEQAEQKKP